MSPFDLACSRLEPFSLRMNGPDRGRACCPVCGKLNPSTLSIGVAAGGAVLLKCWKSGCDVESICSALGLDVCDLFAQTYSAPLQRRRLLTAAQALELLNDEAQLVALVASDVARGEYITDADCDRVLTAAGRIAYLLDEVRA